MIAFARGDAEACTRHALGQLDVAAKVGIPAYEAMGLYSLGCAHVLRASWLEAAAVLERAIETMRGRRTAMHVETLALERLAEVHLAAGDLGRSRAAVDEAIALAPERGTGSGYRGPVTLARVLVATSGAAARAEAEAALAAAQAQVDESGERLHQPFIHLARAELAAALGDAPGRERELREAHRVFTEMGAPIRAEQVARELGA